MGVDGLHKVVAMPKVLDLMGMRFGRLIVVAPAPYKQSGGRYRVTWRCRCDCGNEAIVTGDGCFTKLATHRATNTPEYSAWQSMRDRCCNPRNKRFRHYGGRGISICDRWRFGENGKGPFECFLADVGRRPSPELSIDRIDNDDGYHPGNVRWATRIQQRRNQRPRRESKFILTEMVTL